MYLTGSFYIPEYFYKMLETLNIALVSTLIGFTFGFLLCFFAARNLDGQPLAAFLRARAFMEIAARLSGDRDRRLLPGDLVARARSRRSSPSSIHTVGALGKMFFEVVENADMKPDEGLRAVGANWVERVWFGIVPQVLPNFMSYSCCASRSTCGPRPSSARSAAAASASCCACRSAAAHEAKTSPSSSCCSAPSSPSTSSRPGCAASLVGEPGLRLRPRGLERHGRVNAIEEIAARHPAVVPTVLLEALFRADRHRRRRILYRSTAGGSSPSAPCLQQANWGIAGTYLADWVSYEIRPDIEFQNGYLTIGYSRFSELGPIPIRIG